MANRVYPLPNSFREREGSLKMHFGEDGVTGTRLGVCNTQDLAAVVRALKGVVLVIGDKQVRYGADSWPGLPRLRCYDVETEPMGKTGGQHWDQGLTSEHTKIVAKYKIQPWEEPEDEEEDKEKPEKYKGIRQTLDYGVEVVTVKAKITDTKPNPVSSNPDGSPAPTEITTTKVVNKVIRIPTIIYTATIPQIFKIDFELLQALAGKVNTLPIFGGARGTVLFDGPKLEDDITGYGERCWKLVMKFTYNPRGWNNSLHPETLQWVETKSLSGDDRDPYEMDNLRRLLEMAPK